MAADLDPTAIHMTLPDKIPWKITPNNDTAILAGDPDKPGLYVWRVNLRGMRAI